MWPTPGPWGGDPSVTPFVGLTVPLSSMLGIELGELLVHGLDVPRAAGLAWPVEPAAAVVALAGEVQALPLLLDTRRAAGLARLKLHIRHGSPFVVVIQDDALRVEPSSSQPVDCHILVDPAAFLLVTFHRISPVGAALTGEIIAWGRKPCCCRSSSRPSRASDRQDSRSSGCAIAAAVTLAREQHRSSRKEDVRDLNSWVTATPPMPPYGFGSGIGEAEIARLEVQGRVFG